MIPYGYKTDAYPDSFITYVLERCDPIWLQNYTRSGRVYVLVLERCDPIWLQNKSRMPSFCYVGGDNKSFARGRKRLAKGKGLFLGRASASRRTCAHGAYDTPYMCGNGNENTSRVYGRFAREVRVCGVSPSIAKGTAKAVPFAMLVETTRLELVTSTMST